MSIIILILAISSFIFSFIPVIGCMISIICAIIAIILALIMMMKKSDKSKKEVSIISLIVSIISIIICIISNLLYGTMEISNLKEVASVYNEVLDSYTTFDKNEKVEIEDGVNLTVNKIHIVDNECIVNISITSSKEDYKLSIYDFYIYDSQNNETYFPKYCIDEDYISSGVLEKNGTKSGNIKFEIENEFNKDNLYLMFRNNKGLKLKL